MKVPCTSCTARLLLNRIKKPPLNRTKTPPTILFSLLCRQLEEETKQANALGNLRFETVFAALCEKDPKTKQYKEELHTLFELHTEWLSDLGVAAPLPGRKACDLKSWLGPAGFATQLVFSKDECPLCK